jgi:hypothetical protein
VISCLSHIKDKEIVLSKLKLGPIVDDEPVRITVELPAAVHRDLIGYAEVLGRETGQAIPVLQSSSRR